MRRGFWETRRRCDLTPYVMVGNKSYFEEGMSFPARFHLHRRILASEGNEKNMLKGTLRFDPREGVEFSLDQIEHMSYLLIRPG